MGRLGRSASSSRVKGSGPSASSGSATPKAEPVASTSGISKRRVLHSICESHFSAILCGQIQPCVPHVMFE